MNSFRSQAAACSHGHLRGRGFTLVELMMVVSVLGIMAAIAAPKFAGMVRKAQEGAVKGNLGMLRSALRLYYADNQGISPTCVVAAGSSVLTAALYPRYINAVPEVKSGLHPPVSTVYCDYEMIPGSIHDGQGWYYDGALPEDPGFGGVWVACDHTDVKGSFWTSY